MEDIFIYLGFCDRTYFYMHLIKDSNESKKNLINKCGQIYNFMIQETMIKYGYHVIIFNVKSDGKIHVVIIGHINFPKMKYNTKSLAKALVNLIRLGQNNKERMCIGYIDNKYEMLIYNEVLPIVNVTNEDICIDEDDYIISTKLIDYL
ncbi:hypothetical protein CE11_00164 [Megavirus courdo11]|uniref:Uncharacterized protein n=3 Tax=Megavirus TaxID=3044761 RepID=K7YG88_9VIRU|nr:hypothetical protein c7_R172 [Megavirus courdo7]AFX92194.1 hypothetical protein CE11_00164 [Megavirus courdo11]AUV58118.1 hypothetical protein [Bandra megavirus]